MLDKTRRYLVVGLGLLGGKYALELTKAGFHVDGINRSGYKSFSNGSVSATYNTSQEQRSQIAAYAMDYLCNEVVSATDDTPLLYAGVIV